MLSCLCCCCAACTQSVSRDLQYSHVKRLGCQAVLNAHQGCVNRLAWNDKGDKLCSGSDDSTVGSILPFQHGHLNYSDVAPSTSIRALFKRQRHACDSSASTFTIDSAPACCRTQGHSLRALSESFFSLVARQADQPHCSHMHTSTFLSIHIFPSSDTCQHACMPAASHTYPTTHQPHPYSGLIRVGQGRLCAESPRPSCVTAVVKPSQSTTLIAGHGLELP